MIIDSRNARRAVCVELSRVDHLEEVLQDWFPQFLQLAPGAFGATVEVISLPQITIRRCATTQPLACRVRLPSDTVMFIQPTPDSSPMLWGGHELEQGEALIVRGGADAEIVTRAQHSHVSITCRIENLHSELGGAVCVDLRAPAQQAVRHLFRTAQEALDDSSHSTPMQGSMLPRLDTEDILAALASIESHGAPVSGGSSGRRALAVRKARAFIHANLAASVRLSDLCRRAHAQARTLEYGFRELLGITPIAYIKVLRLHRARAGLREAGSRKSVTQVALECGFCHLSQFSMDYRRQFGERPSDTRRRGLADDHEHRHRR